MYVPVVALSTENDNKLLEQLKTGFKGTIKWNKYRSQMTKQNKTNHLNYLIDPKFYLSYHLKIEMIEHLFQSIIHKVLK